MDRKYNLQQRDRDLRKRGDMGDTLLVEKFQLLFWPEKEEKTTVETTVTNYTACTATEVILLYAKAVWSTVLGNKLNRGELGMAWLSAHRARSAYRTMSGEASIE